MNVGDYVRTKYGIRKVIQIDNETISKIRCYVLDKFYNECKICSSNYIYDEDIIKSSPNIIDLIEVGDYVNGCPVLHKENNELVCGLLLRYKEENIQNVVTKECFESIEYKVKE